jgi:hypothetical protein
MITLLLGLAVSAGCSAATLSPRTTPAPSVSASEPASAFVVAAQAFLRYTCTQPTTESAFCTDVNIDGLTVEGDTLTVPSSADPATTDRLALICEEIVGSDLLATATAEGVINVVVADESGEQAECEFASTS